MKDTLRGAGMLALLALGTWHGAIAAGIFGGVAWIGWIVAACWNG